MIAFRKQGHRVISLSQQEGTLINDFLKSNDVEAYSYVLPGERSGWWYYLRHLFYFIRFCRKNKVDVVYSHLEPANFVASVGQYFVGAKTFLCRHHIDEGSLYSFDKDLYYKVTYRLAKNIIVVSDHAKKYMIEREGIPSTKIKHINLAYDFNLYGKPDLEETAKIRERHRAEVLLLAACRFTTFKRPEIIIQTLKELVDRGLDVKLILLGRGEMREQLEEMVTNLGLNERVSMPGYIGNVLDYMAAADFFLHPSLLDSSCVAVKEAGLVKLPVIVCSGVGDFDDYLINRKNGFSVPREKFVQAAADIIVESYKNKEVLQNIGTNLQNSVLELFSIENVISHYNPLNNTR
jgi:glycosyltransferase involved in cell wall biosynthesis